MAGKREQQAIDTHKKLLDAATQLFAQNPIEQVRMDWITTKAGYKFLTLYRYFANKQSIFAAVVNAEVLACEDSISREVNETPVAAEKLRTYFKSRLKNGKRLIKYRYLNREIVSQIASVKSTFEKFDANQEDLVAKIIKDGQKSSEFISGDPISIARTILFATNACEKEYFNSALPDDDYLLKLIVLIELLLNGIVVRKQ